MSKMIYKSKVTPANPLAATPEREKKFLPDSTTGFLHRAKAMAGAWAADPQRWGLAPQRAQHIATLVKRFDDAYLKCTLKEGRTEYATRRRDEARAEAERAIRAAARLIRANDSIDEKDKLNLGIYERPKALNQRPVPRCRPKMEYLGTRWSKLHSREVHVLRFVEGSHKAKPRGAVRIELFFTWIEMGAKIPKQPDERARYLRSYTRTPIEVEYPVPPRPMLLVYWARWADSRGEVGPFSKTLRARPEGWSEEIIEARVVEEEPKRLEGPEAPKRIEQAKARRRLAA